jgi:hypothetical protein
MSKRNPIITEFSVQIFADGRINWDGFDEFLWWRFQTKPLEGFEVYANIIARFGRGRHHGQGCNHSPKSRHSK